MQKKVFNLKQIYNFSGAFWGPSEQVLLFLSSHIPPCAAQPFRKKGHGVKSMSYLFIVAPNNPISSGLATLGPGHNLVPRVPPPLVP